MYGSCWVCIILGKNLFKISSTVKIYCTSNLAGIGVRVIIWDSLNLFAEVVNENKKTGRRKWAKVNKHWGLDCAREVVPLKFFQKAKLPPGTINDRLLKKKKKKKRGSTLENLSTSLFFLATVIQYQYVPHLLLFHSKSRFLSMAEHFSWGRSKI